MRAILLVLAVVASLASTGCAIAGGRAAMGATGAAEGAQAPRHDDTGAAHGIGERAARGVIEELASPEGKAQIGAAADEAVRRALARVQLELADGKGPLARDLEATAARLSAAAMQGVDGQLDEMLGGCDGLDRRACLSREVHALAREASAGFMDGILGSRAWIAALVVFLAGVVAALLGRAAWDHLGRGPRHAGRAARA